MRKTSPSAERLAKAEPDRADYQRDLSVSYNKMGDLFSALGQGEDARQAYEKALAIAERLAKAEPDRADYQRDLSVSYEQNGRSVQRPRTGRGRPPGLCESPRHQQSGWQRPSPIAPTTSATSRYHITRMGDLFSALGQGEDARQAFAKALAIRERLAKAEPDRADYQRDLGSVI